MTASGRKRLVANVLPSPEAMRTGNSAREAPAYSDHAVGAGVVAEALWMVAGTPSMESWNLAEAWGNAMTIQHSAMAANRTLKRRPLRNPTEDEEVT